MKTLYLDIFSGISGDMFLAAMMDLGLDADAWETELAKLKLDGYHLHIRPQISSHIRGIKFEVHLEQEHHHEGHGHDHHHADHAHGHHGHAHPHEEEPHEHEHGRDFADIQKLIHASKLSPWVKQKSVAVFRRIAVAEGKVHGLPVDEVHFHEVGAVDSIVDIVGACIALEMLGKPRVLAAPVVEGTGWVDCAHGRFPVPTAATLEILGARGVAVSQSDEPHELVTPTGAAILAEFVEEFAPMEGLVAGKIGYGLGTRQLETRPNCLRAVLGTTGRKTARASKPAVTMDWETDSVAVLQTNLDDINAEVLGALVERCLEAGALDIFYVPATMKKNRPGVVLTILCAETQVDRFAEMLLRETTAFGVRFHLAARRKLRREFAEVATPFGEVTLKLGKLNGQVVQVAPEFESCKQVAAKAGAPLKDVYAAALKASPARKAKKK
jgi:uncharacterized protein (TIGR00299 family) protein